MTFLSKKVSPTKQALETELVSHPSKSEIRSQSEGTSHLYGEPFGKGVARNVAIR